MMRSFSESLALTASSFGLSALIGFPRTFSIEQLAEWLGLLLLLINTFLSWKKARA